MNKEKHREYYKDYELSVYDDFALIKKNTDDRYRRLPLEPGLSLGQKISNTKDFIKSNNR